jgi:hypothetical protein
MRSSPLCSASCAAVLVLCLASAARAEGGPPSPPEGDHPWSIGFSLGYGGWGYNTNPPWAYASAGGTSYATSVSSLLPSVSLERRISARTALLLGATAYLQTYSAPAPETSASGLTSITNRGIGLLGGVRTLVTDPGSPVDVSVYGALAASASQVQVEVTYSSVPPSVDASDARVLSLGLLGGLSVSRSLSERLDLRLDLQLLSASYDSGRGRTNPYGTVVTTSAFSAAFSPAAALGLRLSF